MADSSEMIKKLILQITENALLEERQVDINDFIEVCQKYLNVIDQELLRLQNTLSLKQRVEQIGRLMHNDDTALQTMLIYSHAFEVEFNNFLKRKVHLAWVSNAGNVYLGSEKVITEMYAKSTVSIFEKNKEKSYRGYVKGRVRNFNPFELNAEMQKLQDDLRRSANNKRQLFQEAKRRYNKSSKLNYSPSDQPGLYWAVEGGYQDGNPKNWSKRIASGGYIGEGYVKLLLDFPDTKISPVNGPSYNEDQSYIEILANYSLGGDNIPGIIRGDISATEDGSVQLAIKQGKFFHTASIAGNIGIAKAFLDNKSILLNSDIDIGEIRKKIQSISQVSWQGLYNECVRIIIEQVSQM